MHILFSTNLDPSAELDLSVNIVMTPVRKASRGPGAIDEGEPFNYALLWDGLEGSMRTLNEAVGWSLSSWESRGDSNAARWVVQTQSCANQRSTVGFKVISES